MGLIRFLAIIFIVWLIFRILGRYVFPWLLKKFINKQQEKFQEQMRNHQGHHEPSRKEGEITIEHIPDKKKSGKAADNDGEYVDYEEVE